MKLYRIVLRDGVWQASCGQTAIGASDDREQLIQLARKVAARNDGELYVCDAAGKLEAIYTYTQGDEAVHLFGPKRR